VESLHRYRARAREMAVAVAKDKARQLAQLTGARLGRLVHISDSTSTPYYWYGGRTAAMTANAQAVAEFPAAEVTAPDSVIAGGQVVVEAREELVYALQ